MNDKLLANVRFYFAQAVFNNNCHYKAYDRLKKKKTQVSYVVISISAITIVLLILQVIGLEQKIQSLLNIVAYLGMFSTAISLILEIFNKEDKSEQILMHKIYAEKYKSLRDEYMSLIEEIMSHSIADDQLRTKKEVLQQRYSSIGEYAPETNGDDYKQAQIGLGLNGIGEEFTWSDVEINKFLPQQLRLIIE